MDQEKSEIKRLDWVLDYVATHARQGMELEAAWINIIKEHPTIHIEGQESSRDQLFKKLLKDEYLCFNEHGDKRYSVTFDGIIFSAQGGYQGILDRMKAEKNVPLQMNRLTWILAIGTAVMAFVSVLSYCKN